MKIRSQYAGITFSSKTKVEQKKQNIPGTQINNIQPEVSVWSRCELSKQGKQISGHVKL